MVTHVNVAVAVAISEIHKDLKDKSYRYKIYFYFNVIRTSFYYSYGSRLDTVWRR